MVHSDVGCSRTLPVASSWNGQDGSAGANHNGAGLTVKREPLASVPCQVAEVSTSLHATTTSVKIEPVPPKSENGKCLSCRKESLIHTQSDASGNHNPSFNRTIEKVSRLSRVFVAPLLFTYSTIIRRSYH